ncbi:hypothetical protein GCM10009641_45250 [Mycobacterium cookii]
MEAEDEEEDDDADAVDDEVPEESAPEGEEVVDAGVEDEAVLRLSVR